MKVQDYLYDYLVQHQQLSLPGVGIFHLQTDGNNVTDEDGKPTPSIHFEANRITHFDEQLLLFLKEKTGKMRALAQSDLESFLHNGIQLLNIGKPFDLPQIGSVQKSSEGIYSFQQGIFLPEQMHTEHTQKLMQQGEINPRSIHHTGQKAGSSTKKMNSKKLILFISLLAVAITLWIIFLKFSQNQSNNQEPTSPLSEGQTISAGDSLQLLTGNQDSLLQNKNDSVIGFELLIQSANSADSLKKQYNKLTEREHAVRLDTSQQTARLLLSVYKPLNDTTYVIDSIRKWYRIKAIFYDSIVH